MRRPLALVLLILMPAACGRPPDPVRDAGTETDAGSEEGADAGVDGGVQADGGDPCARTVQRIVALVASPASLSVPRGTRQRVVAWADFDTGCRQEVTGTVDWTAEPSNVARVVDVPAEPPERTAGKAIDGLAVGEARVAASVGSGANRILSNPVAVKVVSSDVVVETRGVWITRFAFSGLDKGSGPAKIRALVQSAADARFNAIFLQVRGQGDAYYRSALVPWWQAPGRQLGADPEWDPLQVAIDAAHARGIQVHAYLNALTGWDRATPIPDAAPGAPVHVLKEHPEWTCFDANGKDTATEYVWAAAEPGYRAHFAAVVDELVTQYELDGVHLDRIRAPAAGFCHTAELDRMYAAAYGADASQFAKFQRDQIEGMVKDVFTVVRARRPAAMVSAAVWGIYQALPGCTTLQGFTDYHQDSLGWAERGLVDALVPMIYWDIQSGACTDFVALLDTFVAGAAGRQILAGMNALEKRTDSTGAAIWVPDFPRVADRIATVRSKRVAGNVVFASAYLDDYSLWDDYQAGPYASPAVPTPFVRP